MFHGVFPHPAKRTHPELLDWLAVKFVESGWSVKAMDRMIVLSNVYRQSAGLNEAAAKLDPDNSLYWRATPRRLEGEHLRDAILTVTGSLNPKQGGAPIRVPIEQEIYEIIFTEAEPDNLWPVHPDAREHDRRSIYLLNKRTVRLPFLANFDQPDTMQSCAARPVSTHPLQALTLLNSNFLASQARRFAERLTTECGDDTGCAVKQAFERTLARDPDEQEKALSTQFLSGEGTLADFCLALLNRTEFVYIP